MNVIPFDFMLHFLMYYDGQKELLYKGDKVISDEVGSSDYKTNKVCFHFIYM